MADRPPLTLETATRWSEGAFQAQLVKLARDLGWGTSLSARKTLRAEADQFKVDPPPLDGLIYHPRYSLGSEPGWPDLTLIRRRDRRLIWAELKAEKGQTSARQDEVLSLLDLFEVEYICGEGPHGARGDRAFGVPEPRRACCPPLIQVFVWRPSDLVSGHIAEVLL